MCPGCALGLLTIEMRGGRWGALTQLAGLQQSYQVGVAWCSCCILLLHYLDGFRISDLRHPRVLVLGEDQDADPGLGPSDIHLNCCHPGYYFQKLRPASYVLGNGQ
jgi:hypothetical protein